MPGSGGPPPWPSELSTSSVGASPSPYQYPPCPHDLAIPAQRQHAHLIELPALVRRLPKASCAAFLRRERKVRVLHARLHGAFSNAHDVSTARRRAVLHIRVDIRFPYGRSFAASVAASQLVCLAQQVDNSSPYFSSTSQQLLSCCLASSPPSSSFTAFTAPSTAPFSSSAFAPLPAPLSAGRVPSLLRASESLRVSTSAACQPLRQGLTLARRPHPSSSASGSSGTRAPFICAILCIAPHAKPRFRFLSAARAPWLLLGSCFPWSRAAARWGREVGEWGRDEYSRTSGRCGGRELP
ncbi:hypothetical protein C8R45DRAFT_1091719 [Mycena sanguinolenta]|nr:hypothetical protein C8R45DRAFT_1091719 [Mycena sanguinolenta]